MNGWLYRLNVPGNATPGDSTLKSFDNGVDGGFWTLPVKDSINVPLVGDCIWQDGQPLATDWCADSLFNGDSSSGRQMGRWTIARHKKTINMAFLDGHVTNVAIKQLWSLRWNHYDATHPAQSTWPAAAPTNNPEILH